MSFKSLRDTSREELSIGAFLRRLVVATSLCTVAWTLFVSELYSHGFSAATPLYLNGLPLVMLAAAFYTEAYYKDGKGWGDNELLFDFGLLLNPPYAALRVILEVSEKNSVVDDSSLRALADF